MRQSAGSTGSVAEWSIAPVLKTGDGQPSVSSNLTASASQRSARMRALMQALNSNPMRFAVIVAEFCLLAFLTFVVMVMSHLAFTDHGGTGAAKPIGVILLVVGAILGLLALASGFVASVVLEKPLANRTANIVFAGLLLGCATAIAFFVVGGSRGPGYLGFGFSGWLLLVTLYGSPLLMAAHVATSIHNGRRRREARAKPPSAEGDTVPEWARPDKA
jgi:hypothetical protein